MDLQRSGVLRPIHLVFPEATISLEDVMVLGGYSILEDYFQARVKEIEDT